MPWNKLLPTTTLSAKYLRYGWVSAGTVSSPRPIKRGSWPKRSEPQEHNRRSSFQISDVANRIRREMMRREESFKGNGIVATFWSAKSIRPKAPSRTKTNIFSSLSAQNDTEERRIWDTAWNVKILWPVQGCGARQCPQLCWSFHR